MAKLTLPSVGAGVSSATVINSNFSLITAFLDTLLSRDGTTPNDMSADLDMDSNDILNAATIYAQDIVLTGGGSMNVAWGSITGTLSSQTDLQVALDAKLSEVLATDVNTQAALDGYVLTSDGAGNAAWEVPAAGGGAWGTITGTLSSQTDLQAVLDLKLESVTSADVDSTGATNTYVLTADGAGNAAWLAPTGGGGGGAWGTITGTLSDQTDLQAELDAKADLAGAAFTGPIAVSDADPSLSLEDTDVVTGNAIVELSWVGTSDQYKADLYDESFVFASNLFTITPTSMTIGGTAVLLSGDVQDGDIDSELATNGQVLTADGAGGASWSMPDGNQLDYPTASNIDRVAYWRLGEASGTTAVDEEATYNLTYQGSPTLGAAPGIVSTDTAVTLDGSTQYMDGTPSDFRGSDSSGSVSFWMKSTTVTASGQIIFAVSDGTTNNRLQIGLRGSADSSTINLLTTIAGTANGVEVSGTSYSDSEWHHMVITSDGAAWKIYVDGTEASVTAYTGSNTGDWFGDIAATTNTLSIGSLMIPTAVAPFNGSLDEVTVHSTTLSSSDVTSMYEAGMASFVTTDLGEYTVANLPAAASSANQYALATDASGGRTIVRSDGTNWKVVAVEGATVTT